VAFSTTPVACANKHERWPRVSKGLPSVKGSSCSSCFACDAFTSCSAQTFLDPCLDRVRLALHPCRRPRASSASGGRRPWGTGDWRSPPPHSTGPATRRSIHELEDPVFSEVLVGLQCPVQRIDPG
jgi:hypothetical protein